MGDSSVPEEQHRAGDILPHPGLDKEPKGVRAYPGWTGRRSISMPSGHLHPGPSRSLIQDGTDVVGN